MAQRGDNIKIDDLGKLLEPEHQEDDQKVDPNDKKHETKNDTEAEAKVDPPIPQVHQHLPPPIPAAALAAEVAERARRVIPAADLIGVHHEAAAAAGREAKAAMVAAAARPRPALDVKGEAPPLVRIPAHVLIARQPQPDPVAEEVPVRPPPETAKPVIPAHLVGRNIVQVRSNDKGFQVFLENRQVVMFKKHEEFVDRCVRPKYSTVEYLLP